MKARIDLFPDLTYRILGSAIEVHRALGPGLLEKTYRQCLRQQLSAEGLKVAAEVPIPLRYKGLVLDVSYFADLVVEDTVLLERKAVDQVLPVHAMQVITYLKLAKLPLGLLLNFNVPRLATGVRRFANTSANALIKQGG